MAERCPFVAYTDLSCTVVSWEGLMSCFGHLQCSGQLRREEGLHGEILHLGSCGFFLCFAVASVLHTEHLL